MIEALRFAFTANDLGFYVHRSRHFGWSVTSRPLIVASSWILLASSRIRTSTDRAIGGCSSEFFGWEFH
jgi:hypothetical protein